MLTISSSTATFLSFSKKVGNQTQNQNTLLDRISLHDKCKIITEKAQCVKRELLPDGSLQLI